MTLSILNTRALIGVEAVQVRVETHLSNGLPAFTMVGLPETAVRESRERVRSALINSGFGFPDRRITVNLAPAELPKAGGRFDLAIALSVLAASGQVDLGEHANSEFHGELALDGSLKQVHGIIPAILAARDSGRAIILPEENREEQDLLSYENSYGVKNLSTCASGLIQGNGFRRFKKPGKPDTASCSQNIPRIIGQAEAKRALLVAAAGRHNLLMVGPPGSGKTLLANALASLLPSLSTEQAFEVAAVYSTASVKRCACGDWRCPPLRSPHHTASSVALSGGGNRAVPGEISLAHNGLLFLDEFPQFKPSVLDAMREPLESGAIVVSRANYRARFPANFQLVAAMNPCPCGYAGDPNNECRCTPDRIDRYLGRVSGPLLDRLDMFLEVPALSKAELLSQEPGTYDWQGARAQIRQCQELQLQRAGKLNSLLAVEELESYCALAPAQKKLLGEAMEKLKLSARGTHRVMRVARTLADLHQRKQIDSQDLLEAVAFRRYRLEKW